MKLSVVIPAHNESGSIRETLEGAAAALAQAGIDYELLVVDDASTDETAAVVCAVAERDPRIRYLRSPYPRGFGFTVRHGLERFEGDAVCLMMADASDSPDDLVTYHRLLESGYDCAFGSRFLRGSRVTGYPWLKLALNRAANSFIRLIFRHGYNDTTNAFKAYRREVIETVQPLLSNHFNLTVELPLKAIVRGHTYGVVPISWTNRRRGLSKLRLQEMGSRYLFIVLSVFLEHHLSRGDYRRTGERRPRLRPGLREVGETTTTSDARPTPSPAPGRMLVVALALVVVGLAYWRLFYGVDFTDEAWYVAVPFRFLLGGKPYVDEVSVPQTTTAVLLYPFLWAYHGVAGRTGIVLFVRHLHLLLTLGVGAAVVVSLRRVAGGGPATLAALAAVAFAPFALPSLSYNSVGSALFTAGLFLGFRALRRRRVAPAAGACLGLAAFAYPPLLIAIVAACAVHAWLNRDRLRHVVAVAVPALGLPVVGFVGLAAVAGAGRIVHDYRRSSRYLGEAGGLTKLHAIWNHEWSTLRFWYLLLPALVLLGVLWRWQPWAAAIVLLALPFLTFPPRPTWFPASLEYVAHLGWLALPLFLALRDDERARALFAAVWVPALIGGLTTAYSSANGGINFGVGFFPATIVTSIFLLWSAQRLVPARLALAALPVAAVTLLLLAFDALPVYRDASLTKLTVRIGSGPFAGLVTSRRKLAFLKGVRRDLGTVGSGCRIAFLKDFPAGYLIAAARPDTNAVWTAKVPQRLTFSYDAGLVRYWRRHGLPNVVVLMRRVPFAPSEVRREHYAARDPVLRELRTGGYRLTRKRLDYLVYRHGTCVA